MKKALFSLGRYYRTVKHLRASQIRTRIFRRLLTAAERIPAVANLYTRKLPEYKTTDLALTRLPLPDQHYLGDSVFEFLSKRFECKDTWFPDGASLLWLFNLHYFDFLHEIESAHEQKRFVVDWITKVPVCQPVGWHPYTSSLRICNWIAHYRQFKHLLSESEQKLFLSSLYNQLRHLRRHIEEDLLANHLIENCRALIVGGAFLNHERFVAHGMKVLLRELPEQVLSDGGHYERSPQYHTEVLLALLDAHAALRQSGRSIPSLLAEKTEAMTHFLAKILDFGKLPILNDTTPEFVPDPKSVTTYAAQELQIQEPHYTEVDELLSETGLYILRTPRVSVTFDVGPIGPDVQPGHAHSDTLAVLVSVDGMPVLIDSGVYTYEAGKDRDYFRSARAHNSPMINGVEQNEMWGGFRVGRREPAAHMHGSRTASLARSGIQVTRKIHTPSPETIEITDSYSGSSSDAIEMRWLLGIPSTERQRIQAVSPSSFAVKTDKNEIILSITGASLVSLEEDPASKRFNSQQKHLCVVTKGKGRSDIQLSLEVRPF
jgi:hypothetical protein